ncbi:MAG: hypothetical protein KC621_19630 [Myxococcales bacterium]|nr:hypothetical protein [Myxococcales bacterium]
MPLISYDRATKSGGRLEQHSEVGLGNWVYDKASLRDFFSMVVVYCPDFPHEDYLGPEQQLTVDSAFAELRAGLLFIPALRRDAELRQSVEEQLLQAEQEFRCGEGKRGSWLVQQVEDALFGGPPLKE